MFLGIDSYVCIVLNPVDKFEFERCKGYFFLTIFSCEKNTYFAPSEPVSDMMTTLHSTLVFYRLGVAHISMLKALEIRNFSF